MSDGGEVARGTMSRDSSPFTRAIGRAFLVSVLIALLGLAVYSRLLPHPYTTHLLRESPSHRDSATIQPPNLTPSFFTAPTWRAEDDSMCFLQTTPSLSRTSKGPRICQRQRNHALSRKMYVSCDEVTQPLPYDSANGHGRIPTRQHLRSTKSSTPPSSSR